MKSLPDQHQLETLTVLVEGRVQGVGFRAATVRQAHQLKLGGWVRNLPDGRVEALIQGEHAAIDRMLSWLLQGPPAARVTGVTHTETPTERHYDRFEQI
ncbi:Acylphosphate phosphohydrolase [Castellaniella defragrans 65Phen]|uniref:Acylphosphatase n=1 Tax=Castellaniella defragrans (strain DSM 12143 / CCUG 39792 / 65Phen) TaxID=1437824 RepID=W8X9A4_CASD6|nr:acylphosphatase [Castellaniella defragrans]CDM24480.1 Acylphosphate phosphohydrolase [Castellaniella defragrans 65Phen]